MFRNLLPSVAMVVVALVVFFPLSSAAADDTPYSAWVASDAGPYPPLDVDPQANPDYGKYSYRHGDLHRHGTIQQLLDAVNNDCCDGGHGGECRVTTIINIGGYGFFQHGDTWCPLSKDTRYASVPLPPDAKAVVCASRGVGHNSGCPNYTYCAGMPGAS